MARKARERSKSGIYAVILSSGMEIFTDAAVRDEFTAAAEQYLGSGLLGLRFAGNHADMLVRESSRGISMDMKSLTTSFARTYNRISQASGKVFADRFKSFPVETADEKELCLAYINGGQKGGPFLRTSRGSTEKAVVPTPPPAPKPKKRKQLPSWLL